MRATLLDIKNSSLPGVLGINACDPRFSQLVNEAQQRVLNAGRWWDTIVRMRVCVTQGCIVWPRMVRLVEGFDLCSYSIPLRNKWYEFQENVRGPKFSTCSCDQTQLLDRNQTPVLRNIGVPSYIRVYPTSATDAGKRILFQGSDGNGVPIRTLDGANGWVNGEWITLAYPFATSTMMFKGAITGVQKAVTNSFLTVYSVAQITTTETLLASYEPNETNPYYRKSFLLNMPTICNTGDCTDSTACNNSGCADNGDGCTDADEECTNVMADVLVRLQYVPALADTDWLLVGNTNALKRAVMANHFEDVNDMALAEQNWQSCLRLLRDEMNAESPPEMTVINPEVMGTAPLYRVLGGFI